MIVGRNYWRNPEILLEQLKQMSTFNERMRYSSFLRPFVKLYVLLFGIPEIGVQLRAFYFLNFLNAIDKRFKPKYILDAGSGIGMYFDILQRKYRDAKFHGLDIDRKKISFCKKFFKNKNFKFNVGDLDKFKTNKKYDLILSIDVLEHLNNPDLVLNNLFGLCNDRGYLFLHTHLIPKRWFFKTSREWKHKEHVREGFGIKELLKIIEKAGFKIVKIKRSLGNFGSLPFELYLIILGKSLFLASLVFPIFHLISRIDYYVTNFKGHTIAILAMRER